MKTYKVKYWWFKSFLFAVLISIWLAFSAHIIIRSVFPIVTVPLVIGIVSAAVFYLIPKAMMISHRIDCHDDGRIVFNCLVSKINENRINLLSVKVFSPEVSVFVRFEFVDRRVYTMKSIQHLDGLINSLMDGNNKIEVVGKEFINGI